jgi:hypothetical protein
VAEGAWSKATPTASSGRPWAAGDSRNRGARSRARRPGPGSGGVRPSGRRRRG